jgi:hypothetical protein
MNAWSNIRQRITEVNNESDKWKSQRKHLLEIIKKVELWDIEPPSPDSLSTSNLTEIISEARLAIKKGNRERLEQLFQSASKLTTTQLRLELRGDRLYEVKANKVQSSFGPLYTITVDEEVFTKIQNATLRSIKFNIQEDNT